jgi:hypothetical protein
MKGISALFYDLTGNTIINVKNTFVNDVNKYFYFTFGFHIS